MVQGDIHSTGRWSMVQRSEDLQLLLRIPEVAGRLGLGRSTVYELIQSGELPVVRIGRSVRVSSESLRRWVEQRVESSVPFSAA
jgi:excisionase family DNA binding protein